ncbi:MAG: hypothetical protein IJU23_15240, partial [Proteobacteria bacterium]|nr:hypothetical protein [Pseudomonadota bacterium]
RQEAGVNRSVPDGDSWVRQRPEGAQHKPQKSSQRVCNSAAGTPYVNRRAANVTVSLTREHERFAKMLSFPVLFKSREQRNLLKNKTSTSLQPPASCLLPGNDKTM